MNSCFLGRNKLCISPKSNNSHKIYKRITQTPDINCTACNTSGGKTLQNMDIYPSNFMSAVRFLEWIETFGDLDTPVTVQIQGLKLKARFLNSFFSCTGKWFIDDKNLQVNLWKIEAVSQSALRDLKLLWADLMRNRSRRVWSLQENLDCSTSSALDKLDLLKPFIKEVYDVVSRSTRTEFSSDVGALVQVIEALLGYLDDLMNNCKAHSIVTPKEEIKALEENLRYLEYFFWLSKNWRPEHEKLRDVLIHSEAVADSVACLLYLYSDDSEMNAEDIVNEMKLQLSYQQQKIEVIKGEVRVIYIKTLKASQQSNFRLDELFLGFLDSFLGDIIGVSNSGGFRASIMYLIEALHKELIFLRYFLIDPSAKYCNEDRPKVSALFLHIKVVVCEAACILYSSFDHDIDEDMAREMNLQVSDLLLEFKSVKEEARAIYDEMVPIIVRSNFPITDELGFMDFVIQNIKELIDSQAESIARLQYQIGRVYRELLSMEGDFLETTVQPSERGQMKELLTLFKDIVYHTEYVVDIFRDDHVWHLKLGLFVVLEDLNLIRRDISHIKDWKIDSTAIHKLSKSLGVVSSQANLEKEDALPGYNNEASEETYKSNGSVKLFEEEAEQIKEQLENGSKQKHLLILSIVGMPGIGKTTLANSIYEDKSIPFYFAVRAKCCVTQSYTKRRLLLEILDQVSEVTDKEHEMDDNDLATQLYRRLKGRKYIILFDDLWDLRPWNDVRACFEDDKMGSRIIFTSRLQNIGSQVEFNCTTYTLSRLSDSKSWELLRVKLFYKEPCPTELFKIGQKIVSSCKGLTIAVDLMVGLLRTKGRKKQCWEKVANSLSKHLLDDQKDFMGILELSYDHLPNHLKPCFLYFGAFPADKEVVVRQLSLLWIAEGFVQQQNDDKRRLEDVAEKYLNDLIARSLVIESKKGSLGGVKAVRIHDLLRDFALAKAKTECFLLQDELLYPGTSKALEPYRLSLSCRRKLENVDKMVTYHSSRVRSLVLLTSGDSFTLKRILEGYKLLRVLNFSNCNADHVIQFKLARLRFLSLTSNLTTNSGWVPAHSSDMILSQFGDLQDLETFQLKLIPKRNVKLPDNFWNMPRLRHFKIMNGSYTLPR